MEWKDVKDKKNLRNLISDLKHGVKKCEADSTMHTASWGYEEGILLTGEDAKLVLKYLPQPHKKDSYNNK